MSVKPETESYRMAFTAARDSAEPQWLVTRREAALARFEALGFPTRRDEAWRFTDLRPLQRAYFPPLPSVEREGPAQREGEGELHPRLTSYAFPGETHRLVLVNGRFAPALSSIGALPKGVWLASTALTLAERPDLALDILDRTDEEGGQSFSALNAALFADGFVLALEDGVALEKPIEITHWGGATGRSFHLRNLIRLGAGSRATVIETFAGDAASWTNAVAIVDLARGAALRHAKLQDEAAEAIHFGQVRTALAQDARYESFVLTLGGRLSRHDSFVRFDGEGAAAGLFGAYLLRGEQEATNTTIVDHAAPSCRTSEVFKGVVDERAHGAFLGRIAVREHAQKTDAKLLNKNLLLSPRAAVDTKPELEILADDVKCGHGATVGDLDEEALFYLEARGIPADEARRMLIEAFATDAIDQIEDDAVLRGFLAAQVQRWLGRVED
jgi:Fe-S cluster assembly protein SufD